MTRAWNKPDLGEQWNTAIDRAYEYGYKAFAGDDYLTTLKGEFRGIAEVDDADMARNRMMNDPSVQSVIFESEASRALWDAIDDFYREHRPATEYENLQREAVVAEDIDIAFEAGAMDALLGLDQDLEQLETLK